MNVNQTLTVLVRRGDGQEFVMPALQVSYVPGSRDDAGLCIVQTNTTVHLPSSKHPAWDSIERDVFIMNAAGQTVARYSL